MFLVIVGMMMMALSGSSLGTGTSEHHNHNEDHHDALCGLLGAAVRKWKRTHNPTTKKVLAQAIFGNESGGNLNTLLAGLPETHHKPGNRHNWCGSCAYGGDHYPGKSIPHDMLCMCTVGEGGFPFLAYSDKPETKLCGKSAADLGCKNQQDSGNGCHSNQHWWTTSTKSHNGNGEAKVHLNVTWEKVVKPCLQGGHIGRAKKTLLEKLNVGEYSSPRWGWGHTNCGGDYSDVCVSYGHQCHDNPKSPQWWQELYEALTTTEDTHAKGKSTRSTRKRTRRNTGGSTAPEEEENDSEEDEPEDTGTESTNNHNRQLPLLSHQQSGTSLTQPHSWLLSGVFFF
ncbi:Variant surface glycoprotein [Trypanosoma congolense IL3000]|uniref:Variant surface glycoprotein n=1 Tax=Trypanosoma congolense (strain IL3000) TaxID=1068625 RepID=F9W3J1_TRYCI|nr:Variant surface glycoprotein [Trypanosoma congolense IL3000]